MRKRIATSNAVAWVLALASPACLLKPNIGPPGEPGPLGAISEAERLGYIRHAQVWHRTDVSAMDLARGPQDAKSFTPFQTVTEIRDMFAAGTIDKRGWPSPRHDKNNGTLENWVQAFKRRRDEIVNHHCSS